MGLGILPYALHLVGMDTPSSLAFLRDLLLLGAARANASSIILSTLLIWEDREPIP